MLEDTHHAGIFHIADFKVHDSPAAESTSQPRMALRRLRPPLNVRMVLNAGQPALFFDGQQSYRGVTTCFGPWRSNGAAGGLAANWDNDEWDVLAQSKDSAPLVCLLVMDRTNSEWRIEAWYD